MLGGVGVAGPYDLGRTATHAEIKGWDIDVRGDGKGLPEGSGSVKKGEQIFNERCVACHGDFGEGRDRWPQIAGGIDSLTNERPEKTTASYWPYAPVLFDYIRRAMPFGAGLSMSVEETYSVTAYVLHLNDLLAPSATLDAKSLAAIKMPNANGFIRIDDQKPDVVGTRCMKNCKTTIKILSDQARSLAVTPDQERGRQDQRTAALVAASRGPSAPKPAAPAKPKMAKKISGDIKRGKRVFAKCKACHITKKDEGNSAGPNLYGMFGRRAGSTKGFRYSPAMKKSTLIWTEENFQKFIAGPRKMMPGTRMVFRGISSASDRAALIAYLRFVTTGQ
jgi:cytochrome c